MKVFTTIAKLVAALAAIAGIVYLAATYGDKIVAWCKKVLASCPCCKDCCECECECDGECECECECHCCEEAAEPEVEAEVIVAEDEPVAEETDFEA